VCPVLFVGGGQGARYMVTAAQWAQWCVMGNLGMYAHTSYM
jgi:hypothetical protein